MTRGESLRATEAAMREVVADPGDWWMEQVGGVLHVGFGEPTDATVSRRVDAILRAVGVKARGR